MGIPVCGDMVTDIIPTRVELLSELAGSLGPLDELMVTGHKELVVDDPALPPIQAPKRLAPIHPIHIQHSNHCKAASLLFGLNYRSPLAFGTPSNPSSNLDRGSGLVLRWSASSFRNAAADRSRAARTTCFSTVIQWITGSTSSVPCMTRNSTVYISFMKTVRSFVCLPPHQPRPARLAQLLLEPAKTLA
ncbi:Uu.00g021360.m01.CDS01 [Anthostomella pinea]|uniref:Uu.00g021360.m01.CDS01 n=1 Tax=Anthostomella pinea TaxID=933095 RepID=A0AAI8VZP6_9PEZI|nr:Uu.00g021360.m01.CDS01 [Anthostomella pinea]